MRHRQAAALLAAIVSFACATGTERFGRPLVPERVAQIEPGRTTRTEVLALLGPPVRDGRREAEETAALAEREPLERALYWEYRERREQFATAILFTYFSQETLVDSVMVLFDARGVVEVVAIEQETKR